MAAVRKGAGGIAIIPTLKRLIQRHLSLCVSTSGVEQNFSLRRFVNDTRRNSCLPHLELDKLTINTFDYTSELSAIFDAAESARSELHGRPRAIHTRPTRTILILMRRLPFRSG